MINSGNISRYKNNLNCNEKITTPSMYNNVKQGIDRLNIYKLNGWKDKIDVNYYDDIVISYLYIVLPKMPKTNFKKNI